MVVVWSDVLRPADEGVAVFDVAVPHRRLVLGWVRDLHPPHARSQRVREAIVDAWAVLDGGVLDVRGSPSLPDGLRVVGFTVFRLLLADLELPGPEVPFPGEQPVAPDRLRGLHSRTAGSTARVEQAGMLAECGEAAMLRCVAAVLGREHLVGA